MIKLPKIKVAERTKDGSKTTISVSLHGAIKLLEGVDRICDRHQLLAGIKYAAEPMVDEMKSLAPKHPRVFKVYKYYKGAWKGSWQYKRTVGEGELREDIKIRGTAAHPPAAWIGPSRKTRWYAKWIEHGVQPHTIKAPPGGFLHWRDMDTGKEIYAHKVDHPGVQKTPFVRPAYDRHKTEIVTRFTEYMSKVMEENVRESNIQ